VIANLVPACDRCGHPCDTDKLVDDGLGHICGRCFVGAEKVRGELRLGGI
jgi:hypothetical protein